MLVVSCLSLHTDMVESDSTTLTDIPASSASKINDISGADSNEENSLSPSSSFSLVTKIPMELLNLICLSHLQVTLPTQQMKINLKMKKGFIIQTCLDGSTIDGYIARCTVYVESMHILWHGL